MFDVIIRGGLVVAGDGSEPVRCDISIEKDRIIAIEPQLPEEKFREVIDAKGLVVTPGFVDAHSHGDLYPFRQSTLPILILQGVTTSINGNCGSSPAPCSRENQSLWRGMNEVSTWGKYPGDWEWESMAEFLGQLKKVPIAGNFATLAGLGPIRLNLVGPSTGSVSSTKIYEESLKALNEGAFGISLGPYFPCVYSKTEDFEAAARAVAKKDAVLTVHMRNYGDEIEESFKEYLNIARMTGCSLQISHLYAAGKQNWPRLRKVITIIEEANNQGVNVNYDRHVYPTGMTNLVALLPPWAQEGGLEAIRPRLQSRKIRDKIRKDLETGISQWDCLVNLAGWENIDVIITENVSDKRRYSNKDLRQISQQEGVDPVDALCELVSEYGEMAAIIIHHMEEQGIVDCLTRPLGMIGSDSAFSNHPHPRTYGNFAKWFGHYISEKKILPIGEAVYKCTGLPCKKFGIRKRGVLKPGNYADITVFDLNNYYDKGTYEEPAQHPTGVKHVLVNGKLVVYDGKITGALPGKILSH